MGTLINYMSQLNPELNRDPDGTPLIDGFLWDDVGGGMFLPFFIRNGQDILLRTPEQTFAAMIPWLLLGCGESKLGVTSWPSRAICSTRLRWPRVSSVTRQKWSAGVNSICCWRYQALTVSPASLRGSSPRTLSFLASMPSSATSACATPGCGQRSS